MLLAWAKSTMLVATSWPGMVAAWPPSRSARRRHSAIRSRSASLSRWSRGGLDMDRRPRRAQPVGDAARIAHERRAARVSIDADQHPLARRPRPLDGVGAHVGDHLLVDPLSGAAQGKFAQRGQVAGLEVAADGALGLLRQVDLPLLEALDEVFRGQIDDLDVVGAVDDRVRHRLAHAHAGDRGDDVVEAFDVLDVQRRVDVDAGGQQFLDVEVAFRDGGCPARWCGRVRRPARAPDGGRGWRRGPSPPANARCTRSAGAA